jgi:lipopolysaccharide/colanic/teichoic acid biosynthesis glycosyltransferase
MDLKKNPTYKWLINNIQYTRRRRYDSQPLRETFLSYREYFKQIQDIMGTLYDVIAMWPTYVVVWLALKEYTFRPLL